MLAAWLTSQIAFNGLVQGMVYGLLGMTIVLLYRSSKVINFAIGSMGLIGSALLVMMTVKYSVPYAVALPIALAAGVVYGAIIELVVIRRLFHAPRVIVLVATIGVSAFSSAILLVLPENDKARSTYPLPIDHVWKWGADLRIKSALVLVLVVVPVVALGLGWFLTRTLTGRVVRAAAVNPDLARLRGVNPKTVSTLVWAIGGGISTIAMMLVGGIDGSAVNLSVLGPASMLRALAAALFSGFVSFRRALIMGIVVGVLEALLRFNFIDTPGIFDALLLLAVLVAIPLVRAERSNDGVFAFNPKVEAMPASLSKVFWARNIDRITMLALLVGAIALPFVFTKPSQHVLYASIAAFTICALSLTVLTGWAGQLSLGQMSFAGLGALFAAAFVRGFELDWALGGTQIIYFRYTPLPFLVSALIATLLVAGAAALIGAGALRIRGLLLAVSTFAFGVAASAWLFRLKVFTGEAQSSVRLDRGRLFGLDLQVQRNYYFVVIGVLILVVALLGRIRRSGVGRVTLAVRDNAATASAYTIRPSVAKLRAFALAGGIAGLGGALIAGISQQITFGDGKFLVDGSLRLVSVVVIGGMGSIAGALLGAIFVIGVPSLAPRNAVLPLLSSSLGLLILLLYFPGGFANIVYRVRGAIYRKAASKQPPIEKHTQAAPPAVRVRRTNVEIPEVPLRVSDVSVTFGGVAANAGISLEVRKDEIVGLIGTNGAGKTTLMNAIGGFVSSTGRIELLGKDVSDMSPALRARHGLGRSFQAATLFPELSVRETIEVALEARGRSGLVETMVYSPRMRRLGRQQRAEALDLLDFLGLGRYADRPISELSTGTRRIVELGGLLAVGANVLCLDEPTAGIAQREAEAMAPLLVEVRKELGASMLLIEHDMPLVMSMSDRVYCLELGRVIAEGDPSSVRNDPKVIASYLGMDERAIDRSDLTRTD